VLRPAFGIKIQITMYLGCIIIFMWYQAFLQTKNRYGELWGVEVGVVSME
jgi:hypothetical protein